MNRKATWITLAVLLAVWAAAEWWRAKSEGRFAPRAEAASQGTGAPQTGPDAKR